MLAAGLWQVKADPAQLENAILNLAVNARDAMPGGGRLTIETLNAFVDDAYAQEYAIETGQYVLIAVADTGAGMAPEVIAKAFDPFFTTKGAGKGTGLGLSQVYGFVRQSGGHVKIYSELGVGTSVKIYLPRLYGEAAATEQAKRLATIHRGLRSEIILVVEDEERVRALSVEALRELGYSVVEASGPSQALRMLDEGQQVNLLFTDVVMPDMSGRQLADRARGETAKPQGALHDGLYAQRHRAQRNARSRHQSPDQAFQHRGAGGEDSQDPRRRAVRRSSQSPRLEVLQQGPDRGLLFVVHLIRVEVREEDF